jgi:hypothetical protein
MLTTPLRRKKERQKGTKAPLPYGSYLGGKSFQKPLVDFALFFRAQNWVTC